MRGLVSVIIVNWNGLSWLPVCMGTLHKQDYKQIEIIFVDNASHDGSVAWVKKHYPDVQIIINKKNTGFARGNNIGYKKAKGEYILFLNNDTRVTKQFITELINVFKSDPAIGGAQSKILLMDEKTRLDSIGAFFTPTGFLYHYKFGKKDEKKYDRQIDLYTLKGACMMFRRDVLESVEIDGDIFDPDFFAYFEETDLCHRVWLSGKRIVYAPKSVIYHKMGATSSLMDNAYVQFHSFKNRIASYVRNLHVQTIILVLPVHILFSEGIALRSLLSGKIAMFLGIQKALWWNVWHIRKNLSVRRLVQERISRYPDDRFLKPLMRYPKADYYFKLSSQKLSEYEDQ